MTMLRAPDSPIWMTRRGISFVRLQSAWPLLGGMLLLTGLDQLSKALAKAMLLPGESIPLLPGVFQLTLTYNTGAAFSMLRAQPHLLLWVTGGIFGVLLWYGVRRKVHLRGETAALALILGGALGNLIDRLRWGRVTDFFDLVIIHYPIFNVADSFIFCGVLWLLWVHFRASAERPA